MENMIARLESLEARIRRWKLAAVLLLVGIATMLLSGVGPLHDAPARRLAAENFVLVDEHENTYARLTVQKGAPVLEFYDANGKLMWSAPPKGGIKPLTTE